MEVSRKRPLADGRVGKIIENLEKPLCLFRKVIKIF